MSNSLYDFSRTGGPRSGDGVHDSTSWGFNFLNGTDWGGLFNPSSGRTGFRALNTLDQSEMEQRRKRVQESGSDAVIRFSRKDDAGNDIKGHVMPLSNGKLLRPDEKGIYTDFDPVKLAESLAIEMKQEEDLNELVGMAIMNDSHAAMFLRWSMAKFTAEMGYNGTGAGLFTSDDPDSLKKVSGIPSDIRMMPEVKAKRGVQKLRETLRRFGQAPTNAPEILAMMGRTPSLSQVSSQPYVRQRQDGTLFSSKEAVVPYNTGAAPAPAVATGAATGTTGGGDGQ